METTTLADTKLGPVLITLSQLATQLGVTVQTLYDLRSHGLGPRGFGVGRELRFGISEVDSWLAQLEADDADDTPARPSDAHRSTPAPRSAPTARSTPDGTAVAWWRRPASVTSTAAYARSEPPDPPRQGHEPG